CARFCVIPHQDERRASRIHRLWLHPWLAGHRCAGSRTAPGPQSPHAGRAAWRAVGAHRARDVLLQRAAGRRAVPQPGDPLRRQLPGRGVRVEAVGGAVRGTAPAPVLEQRGGAPGNRAERHAHLSLGIGNRPAQPPAGRLAHALRLGTGRGADLAGHSRRVVNALRWPPDDASLHTAIGGRESADRLTMLYPGGPFRRVVNAPRWPPNAASVHPAIGGRESVDRPTVLYPGGPFRRVVNAPRWPPNDAAAGPLFLQPLLRHFLAPGELALLAVRVEDDRRLALLQGAARAGDAGFQGRVVAVVGALAGHEVFQQAGEGVGFEQVVGNQHGALQKTL